MALNRYLLTLRKHKTELLAKTFVDYCKSTVYTAAYYRPLGRCIPLHNFVSVSAEYNHNLLPCG